MDMDQLMVILGLAVLGYVNNNLRVMIAVIGNNVRTAVIAVIRINVVPIVIHHTVTILIHHTVIILIILTILTILIIQKKCGQNVVQHTGDGMVGPHVITISRVIQIMVELQLILAMGTVAMMNVLHAIVVHSMEEHIGLQNIVVLSTVKLLIVNDVVCKVYNYV